MTHQFQRCHSGCDDKEVRSVDSDELISIDPGELVFKFHPPTCSAVVANHQPGYANYMHCELS